MRLFRSPYIARFVFRNGIWKGRDKRAIYLTFDDGPHPVVTPYVLDVLKNNNIKATFFCVGNNVEKYPEVYRQILEEGHQVGNHTMFHENGTKTPRKAYTDSVEKAATVIESELFRPPYGKLTPFQFKYIFSSLKKKVVFWTWLAYDFDSKLTGKEIIKKAEKIKAQIELLEHLNLIWDLECIHPGKEHYLFEINWLKTKLKELELTFKSE
jgi:peptidoglycan/xylan/chitin deacetylase (PgdA/CDA1 family)